MSVVARPQNRKRVLPVKAMCPKLDILINLAFQGLSVSWKREGKWWEGPVVRVQKEISTV